MHNIEIYPTPDTMAVAAGELFITLGRQAIAERGQYDVLLSGGSTPRAIYTWIGAQKDALDWSKVSLFFGDERYVPHDHEQSNYRMVRETMLDTLAGTGLKCYPIMTDMPEYKSGPAYEATLRDLFGTMPAFDLVYLGIGQDSHTASLFPHSHTLEEKDAWFTHDHMPLLRQWRITATAPLLNNGRTVAFCVSGEAKAQALYSILRGAHNPDTHPAQLIQPTSGDLRWLVDNEAAWMLREADSLK